MLTATVKRRTDDWIRLCGENDQQKVATTNVAENDQRSLGLASQMRDPEKTTDSIHHTVATSATMTRGTVSAIVSANIVASHSQLSYQELSVNKHGVSKNGKMADRVGEVAQARPSLDYPVIPTNANVG